MIIDLRLMSFATLWKKLEKKLNTDKIKTAIRNGEAIYKFADYASIKPKDNTITQYKKDGEIIELSTTDIIKEYCEKNGIEIVKNTRKNYAIEFVPSEKAIKEFNKMLQELEEGQHKNISKVASQIKDKMK